MELYRITLSKYAHQLYAPGFPGRWNSKGVPVIYCSWSRSLACIENLVHRSNIVISNIFSVMIINIDDDVSCAVIDQENLIDRWYLTTPESYGECQQHGDMWFNKNETCLLKVPSALIQQESNYIINPNHLDFKAVKIIGVEEFSFDDRIFQKTQ